MKPAWMPETTSFTSSDEPDYRKMRRLVQGAIQPPAYRDIAGTCGRDRVRSLAEIGERAGR